MSVTRQIASLLTALTLVLSVATSGRADDGVEGFVEYAGRTVSMGVGVASPAATGGKATPVSRRVCMEGNNEVPCERNGGRWNAAMECYVRVVENVSVNSPWNGHFTGKRMECTHTDGFSYIFWDVDGASAEPPPDPRVLAEQAVSSMTLQPIDMGMNPPPIEDKPEAMSVVGWNNWLWANKPTKHNWGPITATASAGGYTVTATAKVKHVIWDMGNGDKIKCGKGTPWRRGWDPNQPSPTCNYMYEDLDQYTVTATSHWIITWEGIGETGSFPMELSDTRTLEVGELHVLNVPTKKRR